MTAPSVLFISAVHPFPADNGKKVVISGFLKFLVEEVGAENITYLKLGCLPEPPQTTFRYIQIPRPPSWRRVVSAIWESFICRRRSLQESFLYSPRIAKTIRDVVEARQFDTIICDTVRVGQFFEKLKLPHRTRNVLYLEDLFSHRYGAIIAGLRKGLPSVDPLGNFAENVPAALRSLVRLRGLQILLFSFERRLIAKRELALARQADCVCLVNANEARSLSDQLQRPVLETPPFVPEPITSRSPDAWQSRTFIILGALDYQPNSLAVRDFLRICMPVIVETMPSVRVKIIGRGASEEIRAGAQAWAPQCEILGYVDDLTAILDNATAMLVPVSIGSGIKLKSLQALSIGLPLITTANGVEGINVEKDLHCLISNDLAEFPRLMREIMDHGRNHKISEKSAAFFRSRYSKDRIYQCYREAFLALSSNSKMA